MSNDIITLTVPAKPEYVMVARLTSAAFASRLGFDIDQIEDIKMSVAEAIILVLNQVVRPMELLIRFENLNEEIHIDISGQGEWVESNVSVQDIDQAQLSRYILGSMMDNVEFKTDNGIMRAVCMHKGCGGSN
ncbi:MAG: ATP-binding protein [Caldicoprobacterales bacterium]|jgi:serine/threonine-protein kinase RsbW|nr:hypothetical protein [Clostridiales bacterium]